MNETMEGAMAKKRFVSCGKNEDDTGASDRDGRPFFSEEALQGGRLSFRRIKLRFLNP